MAETLEEQKNIQKKVAQYLIKEYAKSVDKVIIDKSDLEKLAIDHDELNKILSTWENSGFIKLGMRNNNQFIPRWTMTFSSFGIEQLHKISE